jgi:Sulfotransferase family
LFLGSSLELSYELSTAESHMKTTYRARFLPFIPAPVMPLVRTTFYSIQGARADVRARLATKTFNDDFTPVFIIGSGRSGTTVLGDIFAMHPMVKYIYEPYDLWAAIQPTTDFLHLYKRGEHHCMLGADAATREARIRFQRLMRPRRGLTLVEKTPINALRIGFLDAIAPSARFVHIMRDGVEVAQSIERVASVTWPMAFRPPMNEWWGIDDAKWTALVHDGRTAGYYSDEVSHLTTGVQRGAYEWILCMREIDNWRSRLGARLIELRIEDLISEPRKMLKYVADGLDLSFSDEFWLDRASKVVRPMSSNYTTELTLPDRMLADFNKIQERNDFKGRATPAAS